MKKVKLPIYYNGQTTVGEVTMPEMAELFIEVLKIVEEKEPHNMDKFFDFMVFKWKQFERLYRIQNR